MYMDFACAESNFFILITGIEAEIAHDVAFKSWTHAQQQMVLSQPH